MYRVQIKSSIAKTLGFTSPVHAFTETIQYSEFPSLTRLCDDQDIPICTYGSNIEMQTMLDVNRTHGFPMVSTCKKTILAE